MDLTSVVVHLLSAVGIVWLGVTYILQRNHVQFLEDALLSTIARIPEKFGPPPNSQRAVLGVVKSLETKLNRQIIREGGDELFWPLFRFVYDSKATCICNDKTMANHEAYTWLGKINGAIWISAQEGQLKFSNRKV